jgi:hypothetical protein
MCANALADDNSSLELNLPTRSSRRLTPVRKRVDDRDLATIRQQLGWMSHDAFVAEES